MLTKNKQTKKKQLKIIMHMSLIEFHNQFKRINDNQLLKSQS